MYTKTFENPLAFRYTVIHTMYISAFYLSYTHNEETYRLNPQVVVSSLERGERLAILLLFTYVHSRAVIITISQSRNSPFIIARESLLNIRGSRSNTFRLAR